MGRGRYEHDRGFDVPPSRREKNRRSSSRGPSPVPNKRSKVSKWPPRFESNGSEYIFDTRSQMFYEARSDFFYEPKSKLYYGNKQRAYFRYSRGEDPPFIEVEKTDDGVSQTTDLHITQPADGKGMVDGGKKIAINLKTKSLGEKPSIKPKPAQGEPAAFAPKFHKKQLANIEKWRGQDKTKRDDEAAMIVKELRQAVKTRKIPKTVKGESICLLCRRKFPTADKLAVHERLSKLHKDNFDNRPPNNRYKNIFTLSSEYVDRAKKRRDLHFGTDSTFVPRVKEVELDEEYSESEDDTSAPKDADIGKMMLQKLGWKEESPSTDDGHVGASAQHQNIRKDWDRIESLAAKRNTSRR